MNLLISYLPFLSIFPAQEKFQNFLLVCLFLHKCKHMFFLSPWVFLSTYLMFSEFTWLNFQLFNFGYVIQLPLCHYIIQYVIQ